ncbi:MAG TPA: hypothetical protein VFV89_12090 [Nocardioides sp.]|uniref:hypothetical protein n=1 Tax=Nocardioides sp. TaxID=35761 RepID=UPI002E33BE66|nr:hypothetical protein [Nocardioides sp.]HEX5088540.1 hypothetical protein [Nocardioides sp.]
MAAVAVPLALRELGVLKFWLPENRRLVPETVFRLGPVFGSMQFGIEMGTGMRTFVTSSVPYILLVDALLSRSLVVAIYAAVGFAVGRALMTVLSVMSGEATTWDFQFHRLRAWSLAGLVAFLGLLALYLVS